MAGSPIDMKSAASDSDADQKRERSSIGFPYNDLDTAIVVAKAIHENAGLSCETDQLAAYMKQSATSGSFRLSVSNARMFGLTENEKGRVTLTELGRRIVDPAQEQRARVEAFLAVPLYRALYEKFKGHALPPSAALEREMATMGVSSKQTDRARQAFDRSATQAGFFEHGKDRLVMPAFQMGSPQGEASTAPPSRSVSSSGNDGGDGLDPFIQGLLRTLPPTGGEWPVEQRAKWLQTAAGIFDLIYSGNAVNASLTVTIVIADKVSISSSGRGQPS